MKHTISLSGASSSRGPLVLQCSMSPGPRSRSHKRDKFNGGTEKRAESSSLIKTISSLHLEQCSSSRRAASRFFHRKFRQWRIQRNGTKKLRTGLLKECCVDTNLCSFETLPRGRIPFFVSRRARKQREFSRFPAHLTRDIDGESW